MRFTAHGLASHRQGHAGMDQTLDDVSQQLGNVLRLAIAGNNARVQRQSHFTGMHSFLSLLICDRYRVGVQLIWAGMQFLQGEFLQGNQSIEEQNRAISTVTRAMNW